MDQWKFSTMAHGNTFALRIGMTLKEIQFAKHRDTMDPAWNSIRIVEQIALETLLTVANTLHKIVRTKLTRKLTAQVLLRNSFLLRMRAE